jgi:diaminopimelate decarboxylase
MSSTETIANLDELLGLFPPAAQFTDRGLALAGCDLGELARRFGTPLYVIDEEALRARARVFRRHLAWRRPESRVVFAGKAFPCAAVVAVMAQEGIGLDVAGGGELAVGLAAGMPAERIVLHGNAKTEAELEMAIRSGVGRVVIDNHDDIDRLERMVPGSQRVLLRVQPGIRPDTHEAIATGQRGSKFGVPLDEAPLAIARLQASERLVLEGLHVHIGSQIFSIEPFVRMVEAIADLGEFDVYDLGGGLAARYTYDEAPPTPEEWIDALVDAAERWLPPSARLLIEPGRSMVASAGLTLYTVVSVKAGEPTFVAVDGGMADNLEVAMFGQRFEAAIVDRPWPGQPVELVGRHCESGDRLISGAPLADPRPGDVVAMAGTGAYCFTMANNYNGALRPPVVFCRDGEARVVVRRETYDDLLARQLPVS